MKLAVLFFACLLSSVAQSQGSAPVLLQAKDGSLGRPPQGESNLTVASDGTVTKIKSDGTTVTATLSAEKIAEIKAEIALVPQQDLVRIDNAGPNPSGFATEFFLTKSQGQVFPFAENLSGMHYGIPGNDAAAKLTEDMWSFERL